jgi:hypothetical protein
MTARSIIPTTVKRRRLIRASFESMSSHAMLSMITGSSKLSPNASKSRMTSDKYSLILVSNRGGMLPVNISKLKKKIMQVKRYDQQKTCQY